MIFATTASSIEGYQIIGYEGTAQGTTFEELLNGMQDNEVIATRRNTMQMQLENSARAKNGRHVPQISGLESAQRLESPSASDTTWSIPQTVLTVAEVAKHLRCSKAHVYNVIEGKVAGVSPLPAISMGRRKLVRRDSLERWKRVNEKGHDDDNMLPSSEIDAASRT